MANIRPLSNELQKKAKEELNEVQDRIQDDIMHIRDWLKKQPHLRTRLDDQWIVSFLRGSKYSLEKTKLRLDVYYSLRNIMPEFYKDRYSFLTSANNVLVKERSFMFLDESPKSPKPVICFLRWGVCNSKTCIFTDVIKYWLMILDLFLTEHDNMVVSGAHVIIDYSEFSLNDAAQCTPTLTKKLVLLINSAYPLRIRGVHIINAPSIFETVYSFTKVFLRKKIKNRVHLYSSGNFQKLYEHIPKVMLPKEYGGENESMDKLAAYVNKKLESSKEFFLNDEKYGVDENLRPLGMRRPIDMIGVEGSFRKLDLD